ncbi:uncharacterized protein TRIADDRAFT_56400 [Trichoplax adhaerens]|uniref:Ubiquitin-like modifier-activating enzyme ATG7 n=1 Tax=Trichoplax adhaerens TaxID=10228 RepID=B3RY11_TRIAD|nr:hypothetical protein TRIADDRAFT_56400 [Trichoplax adhaerens]EDV24953.1 hypothetical protein TRIADDRAFT_56400 [Trichoplax adhaerens]|eukprot:XP_002112843.1 hypothetical protein TRIADDRAFT_56400 [Trichoplax adhaerens]
MDSSEVTLLQFAPFESRVDTGFWHKLGSYKLNVLKLDEDAQVIHGYYRNDNAEALSCGFNVDYEAFNSKLNQHPNHFYCTGHLFVKNTVETFKDCDKLELLNRAGIQLWEDIKSGRSIENPYLLTQFLALTFTDLKKYQYYYWFAFPVVKPVEDFRATPSKPIDSLLSNAQIESLLSEYVTVFKNLGMPFFLLKKIDGQSVKLGCLKEWGDFFDEVEIPTVVMCDPSTLHTNPGWPLRNLLILIGTHWKKSGDRVQIICLRDKTREGARSISHSITFTVFIPKILNKLQDIPAFIGWEKNKRQKLGPRMINLSSSLDPTKLSESAVDLNLKLMRWRLMPSLDLEKIAQTKCLLLGAGTLGCNVARCLMGWGIRNISFIDNGKVSYSNPVRQTLYYFDDSIGGGRPKAETASLRLKQINPSINSTGYSISIPMPGHSVSPQDNNVKQDIEKLEQLISCHDAIFLLMDTRESRWLPTVIAKAKNKVIVINAALGFDTFLVMRHGANKGDHSRQQFAVDDSQFEDSSAIIPGADLGCYFCNDVVAPGNSTYDRTLDQQCTVSRPGVSMIASALAVELLISVLQHPFGQYAPAETGIAHPDVSSSSLSPLGLVPHQILESYLQDGFSFLLKAFNSPTYLEDLTGLTKMHEECRTDDIWDLSDAEEEITRQVED